MAAQLILTCGGTLTISNLTRYDTAADWNTGEQLHAGSLPTYRCQLRGSILRLKGKKMVGYMLWQRHCISKHTLLDAGCAAENTRLLPPIKIISTMQHQASHLN